MATGTTAIGGIGQKGFENIRTGNANINALQRRPEIKGTDAVVSGSVKQRIENTGTGLAISGMQDPIEGINTQTVVFQKKTESRSIGTAISGSLQKRIDSKGIGIVITSSGPNHTQSMVYSVAEEKEGSTISKLVPNLVGTE
ncbi:hypothetical protein J5N97_024580 [Dioscorea zingiberensis]|uniref:Uncharacterized protein n=1 Tax=Dioscorea zingiberensis TaxID=325984 RepID=A0A9D5C7J2_9LILI|nr:hypothetical protein J5N97_024580 [Dioscorea zingiberensis]